MALLFTAKTATTNFIYKLYITFAETALALFERKIFREMRHKAPIKL